LRTPPGVREHHSRFLPETIRNHSPAQRFACLCGAHSWCSCLAPPGAGEHQIRFLPETKNND
jgi:predicted HD phosphohydrolase